MLWVARACNIRFPKYIAVMQCKYINSHPWLLNDCNIREKISAKNPYVNNPNECNYVCQ